MRAITALCAAAMVSGCVLDELSFINPENIYAAESTDELVALGAVKLAELDILDALSGQRLVEPNEAWNWDINADGTQTAAAQDGTWADAPGGTWQVISDQFCRENEDLSLKCSDVYQVGSYFRFTEPDGSLAVWTVTKS